MTTHVENLTPDQLKAAQALLRSTSPAQAARAAGVPESDLHAWLKSDENFRLAVVELGKNQAR